jgi:hypothetical protein
MRERACVSSAYRETTRTCGGSVKIGTLRICGTGSARNAPSAASDGARSG